VMKCQFGYRKVRYRGIAKNGAQVFALLALANLKRDVFRSIRFGIPKSGLF
jgi:IS5 family transposase